MAVAMMTTIQIDDRTAEGLTAMAETQGVTLQVFLASLVQHRQSFLIPGKSAWFNLRAVWVAL
jgi:hypothetical protein